jgi:hypothetical protein
MWNAELSNWKSVSKDMYKYFLDSSEKRLKEILDESEKITTRSYSLLAFVIPVVSLSISSLVMGKVEFNFSLFLNLICLGSSCYVIYVLVKLVNAREVWYLGTEPIDIVNDSFTTHETLTQEELEKALYLSEIEQIQHKITCNKVVNDERIEDFKECLITSVIVLSVTLVVIYFHYATTITH